MFIMCILNFYIAYAAHYTNEKWLFAMGNGPDLQTFMMWFFCAFFDTNTFLKKNWWK